MPLTSSPHPHSQRILIGPPEHSLPSATFSLASGIATWWWNTSQASNTTKTTTGTTSTHPTSSTLPPVPPVTRAYTVGTQNTFPYSTVGDEVETRHKKAHSISEPAAKKKSSLTLPKNNIFERKSENNEDRSGESEDDYLLSPVTRNQSEGVDDPVPSLTEIGPPQSKLYPYSILTSQSKSRNPPSSQSVIETQNKHVVIENFHDWASTASHEERESNPSEAGSGSPLISPGSASGFVTARDTLQTTSPTFVTAYENFPNPHTFDNSHARTNNTWIPSLNTDATGSNYVEVVADDLSPNHRTLQAQAEAYRRQPKPTDAQRRYGVSKPTSIPSPIGLQILEANSSRSGASRNTGYTRKDAFPGKRGILLVRIEGSQEGGTKLYDERTPRKRLGISVGWREYYCVLRKGGSLEFRSSLNNVEFEVPLNRYTQLSVYSPIDYTLALTIPSSRPGIHIVHVFRAQTLPATTAWYRCIRRRLQPSRPVATHVVTDILSRPPDPSPASINVTTNTNRTNAKVKPTTSADPTVSPDYETADDDTPQSSSVLPAEDPNAPEFAGVSFSADDFANTRTNPESPSSESATTTTNTSGFDTSECRPMTIDVYAPDVELRVRVPLEHELVTVWDVRDRALAAMKNVAVEEWKEMMRFGESQGNHITWGLCWRRKERLEWVDERLREWWERDLIGGDLNTPVMRAGDGSAVPQLDSQLEAERIERMDLAKMPHFLEKTHRLELRPITHDDHYVEDPETGERFDEPRPVGGYLVRLRSATRLGHLTGVRKFFYSQGHMLLYCRPAPTNLTPGGERKMFDCASALGDTDFHQIDDDSEHPKCPNKGKSRQKQDPIDERVSNFKIVTTSEMEILPALPADSPTAPDPSSSSSPKTGIKSKLKKKLSSSSTLVPSEGVSSNPTSPISPLHSPISLAQFGEEDDRAETERQVLAADGALDLAMIVDVSIIGNVGMLYGRCQDNNRNSGDVGEDGEETDGEETLLKVQGKDGTELILSAHSRSTATAWIYHFMILSKYWRLRRQKESRLRYFVGNANEDDQYGKSGAEFIDPGWGFASPKLWSYCLVGGCHPPIVKTGPLYYRTGRRGLFHEALFVLTSRHLIFFGPTKRTDQTLQGIIPLAPCYVTTGLGQPEAHSRRDRGNLPAMCDAMDGGLPRIFEDGTVALDDDETCMFAIWRPKSLGSSSASITSATITPGGGRFTSWVNGFNRWKSAKQEERAIRMEEEREARERLAEERDGDAEGSSTHRNKGCETNCCSFGRRWGKSWGRFGRRGINIVLQARTKYEAREWVRAIEIMIERSANVPVA